MQDNYQNPSTPRFKIIFAGECSAGKTSIVMQYAYNKFEINYLGTVGIDFVSHFLNVDGTFSSSSDMGHGGARTVQVPSSKLHARSQRVHSCL